MGNIIAVWNVIDFNVNTIHISKFLLYKRNIEFKIS